MNYLVLETHPAYAVLLDEEGRFLKAANLHYQVGDTVQNIVELRPPQPRRVSPRHRGGHPPAGGNLRTGPHSSAHCRPHRRAGHIHPCPDAGTHFQTYRGPFPHTGSYAGPHSNARARLNPRR